MHLHVATPEPPVHGPGHKRRHRLMCGQFLALYLLISGLLAGAVLVAPQFQQRADAVDDSGDITWDVNGGRPAYQAVIRAVRDRAAGGRVPGGGTPRADHVFTVGLRAGGAPRPARAPLVSLLVRARDLAVVGYRLRTPQGHDSFFYFRGAEVGDALNELRFTGSYSDLERFGGRSLAGLVLNERLLTRSFTTLRDDAGQASTARALMVFTTTVSEAARFDSLARAFRAAFDNGSHTVTRAEAELMNSR